MNPTNSAEKLLAQQASICFTSDEDNYIRLGIKKFGLSWSKILCDLEFHFSSCCVPNTLRKRAEALKFSDCEQLHYDNIKICNRMPLNYMHKLSKSRLKQNNTEM